VALWRVEKIRCVGLKHVSMRGGIFLLALSLTAAAKVDERDCEGARQRTPALLEDARLLAMRTTQPLLCAPASVQSAGL